MKLINTGETSLEAMRLITEDRAEQYGDGEQNFLRASSILTNAFNLSLSPAQIVEVLISVKLAREANKENRDNMVDAIGYIDIREHLKSLESND